MTTKNGPYTDATYIDAEVEALRLRLHRLGLEHRLADAERAAIESTSSPQARGPGIPALRGTLRELTHREQQVCDEIDARLAIHRSSDAPELGLDRMCREHELGERERLLVLALLVPAVSKALADHVLQEHGGFCGHLSVADLCFVLNPKTVEDWLNARALFRRDAPLVKHALVIVDTYGSVTAETLMDANVELSLKAFGIIFNDPEALTEVSEDAGE